VFGSVPLALRDSRGGKDRRETDEEGNRGRDTKTRISLLKLTAQETGPRPTERKTESIRRRGKREVVTVGKKGGNGPECCREFGTKTYRSCERQGKFSGHKSCAFGEVEERRQSRRGQEDVEGIGPARRKLLRARIKNEGSDQKVPQREKKTDEWQISKKAPMNR